MPTKTRSQAKGDVSIREFLKIDRSPKIERSDRLLIDLDRKKVKLKNLYNF